MKRYYFLVLFVMNTFYSFCLIGYGTSSTGIIDTANPILSIVEPYANIDWYIGEMHTIQWNLVDSNLTSNPVQLAAINITDSSSIMVVDSLSNTGQYSWLIPPYENEQVEIVIDAYDVFGNHTTATSGAFTLAYVPPLPPSGITVDISNNWDAVISWQPVTQDIYGNPITPDGYIILHSEIPNQDTEDYYFLTWTTELFFVHLGAVHFSEQRFYEVLAYQEHGGDFLSHLKQIGEKSKIPVSWTNIKNQACIATKESK